MLDTFNQRIEAACAAFFPAWAAIVENDLSLAIATRERMRAALYAGDPVIDLGITEAQADWIARALAEKAVDELDYGWEVVSQAIGKEFRDSAINAIAVELRPILMALAKPPKPKPTAQQLAETVIGGSRECSKCGAKVPVGTYCKSFDCPLNPAPAASAPIKLPVMPFVSVTPPQGGVGATHKL